METNFFTNENQNTLLEKIEGMFKYKKVHFFDVLVGYFRASGYFKIRKFIEQTPKISLRLKLTSKDSCLIQMKGKHKKNSFMN